MKYKAGDRVKIKSLDWYNENKNNRNEITFENNPHWRFVANQSEYCGQIATITSVSKTAYRLENIPWNWTDEMIEGLVEEEIIDLTSIVMETVEEKTIQNTLTYGYNLPEGYQFVDENGNVINATKIVLEKKKKEYPKTYAECCEILGGVKNTLGRKRKENSDFISRKTCTIMLTEKDYCDYDTCVALREFEEFKALVKRMREAQNRVDMLADGEDIEFVDMLCIEQREAEREVDEYLKKME